MRIRIEGTDLPGLTCGPSPERPEGHRNIHVALQGRKGPLDLLGVVPADAPTVSWEIEATVVAPPPDVDLRGPYLMGRPGDRFIYLSWGVVEGDGHYAMFRRAKLAMRAVPTEVMASACAGGLLVGRLGLTDPRGNPVCAAVGASDIEWSAPAAG